MGPADFSPIFDKKFINKGWTKVDRAPRVGYGSYRSPINMRGVGGPGLLIPPIPGPMGPIPDPVGPADVSPPLIVKFFLPKPVDVSPL